VADDHTSPVPQVLANLPLLGVETPSQADGYVARLEALPQLLETVARRHLDGIGSGLLPVRRLAEALVARIDRTLAPGGPDPLTRPTPSADSGVDADAFGARRDRVLTDRVHPALRAYRDIVADHVAPRGRDDEHVGLCWLPGGEAMYADFIAIHTTTGATADELHQLGLDVVAALAEEYAAIGTEAFGTGDVAEVWRRLTTEPDMYFADAEAVLDVARTTVARAEGAAPRWFGRPPATSCRVDAVTFWAGSVPFSDLGGQRDNCCHGGRPERRQCSSSQGAQSPSRSRTWIFSRFS
jgi:uncharacterized protein (DUF885 family)